MFNELTCKVRFHIAVWSLSNAIKESSFIENIPQISTKFPRNSREIGRFLREFVPENPAKFDFFSRDLPEALYKAVVVRRYLLALLSVGLLRKFEDYLVYLSLI